MEGRDGLIGWSTQDLDSHADMTTYYCTEHQNGWTASHRIENVSISIYHMAGGLERKSYYKNNFLLIITCHVLR